MVTELQKNIISLSFFAATALALYCMMTGSWGLTLAWTIVSTILYKVFKPWYEVWKDETKR